MNTLNLNDYNFKGSLIMKKLDLEENLEILSELDYKKFFKKWLYVSAKNLYLKKNVMPNLDTLEFDFDVNLYKNNSTYVFSSHSGTSNKSLLKFKLNIISYLYENGKCLKSVKGSKLIRMSHRDICWYYHLYELDNKRYLYVDSNNFQNKKFILGSFKNLLYLYQCNFNDILQNAISNKVKGKLK